MASPARQPNEPGDAASQQLRRVERALAAFDPADGHDRLYRLLTGILRYANAVDHAPMLVARAVQQYAITSGGVAIPEDMQLPPEVVDADAYSEAAGQVIGALWYLAGHMPETDPMHLQARAHQALQSLSEDESG